MTNRQPLFYLRLALFALAIVLPVLSLVILGSVWLWQHGFVIYWALAACAFSLISYAFEKWMLGVDLSATAPLKPPPDQKIPLGQSPREQAAWASIEELANDIKPAAIGSRDDLLDLGLKAIEVVAKTMHPGEDHALWKFTLPEALLLSERVSSKLSVFVRETIPLGDRLTVGQFLRIYRWKSAIGVAEQVYDIWRIVRLINPAAAAAQEVREQLTKRAYDWGREELSKRILRAYVREVGRAAIDLYSGRMSVPQSTHTAPEMAIEIDVPSNDHPEQSDARAPHNVNAQPPEPQSDARGGIRTRSFNRVRGSTLFKVAGQLVNAGRALISRNH